MSNWSDRYEGYSPADERAEALEAEAEEDRLRLRAIAVLGDTGRDDIAGDLRAALDAVEQARRERDALRDAALALVTIYGTDPDASDGPEADAAWAALCRLLTPSTPTETT